MQSRTVSLGAIVFFLLLAFALCVALYFDVEHRDLHRPADTLAVSAQPTVVVVDASSSQVRATLETPTDSAVSSSTPAVVINEILASNRFTNRDEQERSGDWVELHNRSEQVVDVGGWFLSDDRAEPQKWALPSAAIDPGGYLLVWLTGQQNDRMKQKILRSSAGEKAFRPTIIQAGESWNYVIGTHDHLGSPHESWKQIECEQRFPGFGPSGFGYSDGDDRTQVPGNTTTVFIRKEFLLEDPQDIRQLVLQIDFDDGFIAYLNGERVAAANAPLGEPAFASQAPNKHEPGSAERFDLSDSIARLVAGKNVLAICGLNNTPRSNPSSDMTLIPELGTIELSPHANFKLARAGGVLLLSGPDGTLADSLEYGVQTTDHTYGRVAGSDRWAVFYTPTPARRNEFPPHEAFAGEGIAIAPETPFHERRVRVTLKLDGTAESDIRYTLDGSVPIGTSQLYGGPFELNTNAVVRAAAFAGYERATPVNTRSYFVTERPPIPVLSIAMDPDAFHSVHNDYRSRGRKTERVGHLEWISPDGAVPESGAFGLRLHGGAGRRGGATTKKSYKAYFRSAYGKKCLEHSVFPDLDLARIDKLVLRAGFNDRMRRSNVSSTYVRDQLIRDLHRDMGGLAAHGTWCLLYVNGVFRGLYNPTERPDDEFLQRHTGEKKWDVMKTGEELLAGTIDAWDLLKDTLANDLPAQEKYDRLSALVDVEDFTRYIIVNTWAQNHDWPHNNWYAARPRAKDGKWRFICWDAEWGLSLRTSSYSENSIAHVMRSDRQSTIGLLFQALAAVPSYRQYFLAEVEKHLEGPLAEKHSVARMKDLCEVVGGVIDLELRPPSLRRSNSARDRNQQNSTIPTLSATGADYDDWEEHVGVMRRFLEKRGSVYLKHAQDFVRTPNLPLEQRGAMIIEANELRLPDGARWRQGARVIERRGGELQIRIVPDAEDQ